MLRRRARCSKCGRKKNRDVVRHLQRRYSVGGYVCTAHRSIAPAAYRSSQAMMRSAALVTSSGASSLAVARAAKANRGYAGGGVQPSGISVRPRSVGREVGFLVCDTGASNKAVGSGRASWHRFTCPLRRNDRRRASRGDGKNHEERREPRHLRASFSEICGWQDCR